MKTKTFIEKVEELGFEVREYDIDIDVIDVIDGNYDSICTVSTMFRFVLDTNWTSFEVIEEKTREDLYRLAVEYAHTPLEEREEEKEYRIKLMNDVVEHNSRGSYLNLRVDTGQYMMSSSHETPEFKIQFTQKEINNFPDAVKEILPLCKQIEVTQ